MLNANQKFYIDLLESGEIEQVRNKLRVGDRMCCLGVMCEAYRRITGKGEWVEVEGTDKRAFSLDAGDCGEYDALPPNEVLEFFDAPDESNSPSLEIDGRRQEATQWNDIAQVPFTDIARGFRRLWGDR